MSYSKSPKEIVIADMVGAVPERREDIQALWSQYDPKVVLVQDGKHITLDATKNRIKFDAKSWDVFWLIGFSGWRAIECYAPLVKISAWTDTPINSLVQDDEGLARVERDYRERLAAVKALIETADPETASWPPDVPRPNPDRGLVADPQYQAAFDLTCLAVAFTLFHEFRHVMLDRDKRRPQDLREEELACDIWARDFMTAKLAAYAQDHGHDYHEVLRKRSMGFALAALILHEITPVWDHGGSDAYFSVATCMQTILDNTPLPDNDHFWVLAASLLIGIFRQKGQPISAQPVEPRLLTRHLLKGL
ncbi:MAG: phage exclusion protein Lit family protein [Wenzhouxiangellaceae bacterium]